MTNTPITAELPEVRRAITRYEVVDCIDDKHVPAVIPNQSGPWVLYEDHAAQVEALRAQPAGSGLTWTVFNSGAQVAEVDSLADAMDYLTPERLARQWCAVCVVDQSNLPAQLAGAAPQPAVAAGWVSVKDRLPDKNVEVLIFFKQSSLPSTGQYTGLAMDPDGWCYPTEAKLWPGESEEMPDGGYPTVTHWQPLPPAPSTEGA